jgi:hypothetical protein
MGDDTLDPDNDESTVFSDDTLGGMFPRDPKPEKLRKLLENLHNDGLCQDSEMLVAEEDADGIYIVRGVGTRDVALVAATETAVTIGPGKNGTYAVAVGGYMFSLEAWPGTDNFPRVGMLSANKEANVNLLADSMSAIDCAVLLAISNNGKIADAARQLGMRREDLLEIVGLLNAGELVVHALDSHGQPSPELGWILTERGKKLARYLMSRAHDSFNKK